jgi:hypothetical protein
MLPVRRSWIRKVMSRQRFLEEPETRDLLVGSNEEIATEQRAGGEQDRLPHHPFVGDVVADDVDLVDGGRSPLADDPAQVDHLRPVGGCAAGLLRLDRGVDVAVVGVERVDLVGRLDPCSLVEWDTGSCSPGRPTASLPPKGYRVARSSVENRRLPEISKVATW